MYKCGWNGCEKAYGTLNHLNAHVTMQSHGAKRTPEGESYVAVLHSYFTFWGGSLSIAVYLVTIYSKLSQIAGLG